MNGQCNLVMNQSVLIYPKKTRKGLVFYYLRYYLPGGKRVSKAVGDKKSLARKLIFKREQNLRKGFFDAFGLE